MTVLPNGFLQVVSGADNTGIYHYCGMSGTIVCTCICTVTYAHRCIKNVRIDVFFNDCMTAGF